MLKQKIESLFYHLMAIQSDTNTVQESHIAEEIHKWIASQLYYHHNPQHFGSVHLEEDPYNRSLVWALMKGKGSKTVILIHHHDAIDIEEYGKLKPFALHPAELAKALSTRQLSPSVKADLDSGEWLFGRGSADMKSGAAIQIALLAHYSEMENFEGNILLVSVPDEESLSKGMLLAVTQLTTLRDQYDLEFVLTINSEPYFNQNKKKAIFFEGSVGKIMPVLYVKGVKSHIGDPFAGFNPSLVLADLQRKTELNIELCDIYGNEVTPPPVWVNLKDRKKAYDASIPEAATGYFNWLTYTRSPAQIVSRLLSIAKRTMRDTLIHFQDAYENYCAVTGDDPEPISFNPEVLTYEDLYQRALLSDAPKFEDDYSIFTDGLVKLLKTNTITLPEAATRMIEFVADYIDLQGPTIVIALSGPYYPHVNNEYTDHKLNFSLTDKINEISMKHYQLEFESKGFFMGISDLSYATWSGNDYDIACIKANSPGWDAIYRIPFESLKTLQMPVVNIGPWGKDLHKVTERVYAKDVFQVMPHIISEVIEASIK